MPKYMIKSETEISESSKNFVKNNLKFKNQF